MYTHFLFFYPFLFFCFSVFLFFIYFVFGLGPERNPCGWAGPSRPSRVTGLTRLAIF
jgi:hypothetical protein